MDSQTSKPKVCRFCGSDHVIKRGKRNKRQRIKCINCGKWDTPVKNFRTAKILLVDIETLYMEIRGVWNLKTEYIQPDRVVKDWSILCYAGKWLFEPDIFGEVVTAREAISRKESSILGGLWTLLDQADIVVTHNGNNFDIKRLNTKFIENGYPPPSPYISVDTLKVARDKFDFTSNKLDELGKKLLGLDGKKHMTIEDWDQCAEGNTDALVKMLDYCKNDVAPLLEDLYLRFLPWISNHPNLNLYTIKDDIVCPKCEGSDLTWNTKYTTPQGLWKGFRCNSCGATGRGTVKEYKIKTVNTA